MRSIKLTEKEVIVMIAMAVSFPNSFVRSLVFIFYGNNGNELVARFHDIQDFECHVLNIRDYISWVDQADDYEFTEYFYCAADEGRPISAEDARRFFALCPEVCKLLDFVEGDNALQVLREKYPNALCR